MRRKTVTIGTVWAVGVLGVTGGCKRSEPTDSDAPAAEKPKAQTARGVGPAHSPVEPTLDQGWCGGHGVPESVCTRCNSSLIPKFKEAGDWCAEHGLPESQCTVCHPEVEAEWAELNPARKKEDSRGDAGRAAPTVPGGSEGVLVERPVRLLDGANDPLCPVEELTIRFVDPSILKKAGIEVEPVARRTMSASLNVPAEVEFDATRVTRVAPRVAGVVRAVPVNLGDTVTEGEPLAVIDSPVLGEAKSRFIERAENLRLAEADLRRVRTIARGVAQMLEVCTPEAPADAVREALLESPVGEAKAKLLRAHATLQLARAEAKREAVLLEENITSERAYESARSGLAAAEADFVAIREEIVFDVDRKGLEAERAVEIARSALEAAERRLHILGLTDEQVERIGEGPDELLSQYELRSPVSGRVVQRMVAAGESVEASDVLFVIADTSVMWLIADLYERDLPRVHLGLPVIFTVDGMAGMSFAGRVSWISSELDDRTRTVMLRADLPNPDGLLKAKMFGQARIILHDNEPVVTVPREAVQSDGCCQLVFVRQSDTRFQPRKVMLGSSTNGVVEVIKGLQEGEVVASTGSFLMKTEILKGNIGAGCCEVDPGR